MSTKYPVTNDSKMPIYVGALMIPPGETRHFDLAQLPAEFRPKADLPEAAQDSDPLATILALPIAKAVLGLPALSDDELARLEALEEAGQNRKGMLAEISIERLRRADLAAAGGKIGD